jgi:FtsH-binding integral membrane protein
MDEPLNEKSVETQPEYDQVKLQMLMQEMRGQQNIGLGIMGGVVAAAIGAALWASITALTNYQIGWMAVGVGFLVGFGVRFLGKGLDKSFGVVGALFSLLGCLAGNLLAVCIAVAKHQGIPLMDLITRLDLQIVLSLMNETFNPMDLLFYGIAVYEGYKFSFRPISVAESDKAKI